MKSEFVGVITVDDLKNSLAFLEMYKEIFESVFVKYCFEKYDLVASDINDLFDIAINIGVNNKDILWLKGVMEVYASIESHKMCISEFHLLISRCYHE